MCSCSPLMVGLHKGSHLINALAALNMGAAAAFNYDFIATYISSPEAVKTVGIIIGVSGVISLLMCVMCMMHGCKCSNSCKSSCEKK